MAIFELSANDKQADHEQQPIAEIIMDTNIDSSKEEKRANSYFTTVSKTAEEFFHQAVQYIRKPLRETLENQGAVLIDATQIKWEPKNQVFTDYCHMTPHGHATMARLIADRIAPMIQTAISNQDNAHQ